MLRTEIRTGLIYSLLLILISATAMMGLNVNMTSDQQASVINTGIGMSAEAVEKASRQNDFGRVSANMAGAVKVCCPCGFGQGCSVEKPLTGYARLFTDTSAVRFASLESQPPDAPPRT